MRLVREQTERGEWEMALAAPAPALRDHVVRYCGYREELTGPVRWWEVPGSKVPLIIDLGSGFRLLDPVDQTTATERKSFVAGFHAGPAVPESDGRACCIQVDFTPIGAHVFLGLPMSELTDLVVDVEDVLGAESRELVDRLHDAPKWDARFAIVDRFIAGRMARARPPSREVAWAWDRLYESAGRLDIAALVSELGWSHKRLIAGFREHVGATPKLLARVLRFERAMQRVERDTNWVDLALSCGYYDQAHLIRDFQQFAGMSPGELLRRRAGNSVQDTAASAA